MALRSLKETSTVFGLLGERDATREVEVCTFLRNTCMECTQVLGMDFVQGFVGYENSQQLVEQATASLTQRPVVLYTRMLTRYRVADLPLLPEKERRIELDRIADRYGYAGRPEQWFAKRLASQVALLHKMGGVNDTLEWSNVTAAAEVTDFEWVTVPSIPLYYHDGRPVDDQVHLPERQWKEVIYGVEVCYRFASLIGDKHSQEECIQCFLDEYLHHGGTAIDAVKELRMPLMLERWPAE